MATQTDNNGSEEVINKTCSVCIRRGATMEATKYCRECMDYYCKPCSDIHTFFPALQGHTLLDESLCNGQSLMPTEKCSSHRGKHLDMFCEDHDEVICSMCVSINHRSCQKIHSILDEIDSLYEQSSSLQITDQLLADKTVLEDEVKATKQVLNELRERKKIATDSINDYKADLVTELDKLEKESLDQVDEQFGNPESHLENAIKEAEGNIKGIEQSLEKLSFPDDNKAQFFVSVKTARKNIRKVQMSKELLKEVSDGKMPTFFPDLKLKKYLQERNSFGKLCFKEEPKELIATMYSVNQQRDIEVRITTDYKPCRIFGSCVAADGSLLLADYNNANLKRLDVSTEKIKDHLDLEAGPLAVCQTSKDEAAVSLSNNIIQYVSLGDTMTATKVFKMSYYCSGLAYKDGELFISDGSSNIYMFDGDNSLTPEKLTGKLDDSILSKPRHLSASTNKDTMYVADIDKGLISLDNQGSYLSTFDDPELIEARGVCTDGKGSLFVCGYQSSCVLQINEATRTKLGSIKSKLQQLSVCFEPSKNNLFVTYDGSKTIHVYDLVQS